MRVPNSLLFLLSLFPVPYFAAPRGTINVVSPLPSSLHHTSSVFPVSIPLTVKINIDESDMRDFESHSSSTVESLHMLVQLNSLDNTIRDYDTVAEKRIENLKTETLADLAGLIPGIRSVRIQLVTSVGDVYDELVVEFEVRDEGGGVGSGVDVKAWNSGDKGVGGEGYEDYFSQVYRYKVWSGGGRMGSSSGPGSNLEVTVGFRRAILDFIDSGIVRRIVDVPCGDMTWMGTLLPTLRDRGVKYLGMDVVDGLVQENRAKYGTEEYGGVAEFRRLDLTKEELPEIYPGDLIICRHLMFHLPPRENLKIIEKLSNSHASLLMLTTYVRASENSKDFVLAMGHKVNLFREPYCIKDPETLFYDDQEDLYAGVWDLRRFEEENLLGGTCKK